MTRLHLATLVCLALTTTAASLRAQPVNFAALIPRTDSFVVMVQGNAMGFQRTIVERTETGIRVVDDVQIGPIMSQHTEVELGPDGALRSTRQTGKVRGQDTRIEIIYVDGRAKGTATTPGMAGVSTATIDTTIAAGVIDDNLITALVPAFEWGPSASFTVPVFLSGKGSVQALTLAVRGTESLTVPAGTFDVYRVEMAGGPAAVALYVTTTAPFRLLKIAPRGAPLEFVAAR